MPFIQALSQDDKFDKSPVADKGNEIQFKIISIKNGTVKTIIIVKNTDKYLLT